MATKIKCRLVSSGKNLVDENLGSLLNWIEQAANPPEKKLEYLLLLPTQFGYGRTISFGRFLNY